MLKSKCYKALIILLTSVKGHESSCLMTAMKWCDRTAAFFMKDIIALSNTFIKISELNIEHIKNGQIKGKNITRNSNIPPFKLLKLILLL